MVGIDKVRSQLGELQELWSERGRPRGDAIASTEAVAPHCPVGTETNPLQSPQQWEETFARLAIGREGLLNRSFPPRAGVDPGVRIIRRLIREFRASMLVNVLRLTMRLLMLSLGETATHTILLAFWEQTPPQMYATTEAEKFAGFLERLNLRVPHLAEVLSFERALLATAMDDQARIVPFDSDPIPLLRALADGHLPEIVTQPAAFEIQVTPDAFVDSEMPDLEWLRPNIQGRINSRIERSRRTTRAICPFVIADEGFGRSPIPATDLLSCLPSGFQCPAGPMTALSFIRIVPAYRSNTPK